MVSWHYLPSDLIPFIRRMSVSSYQRLSLEEYFLQTTNLSGVLDYLYEQLKNLSSNSKLEIPELCLFAFASIYNKKPAVALKCIEDYSNDKYQSPHLLSWHFALVAETFRQENNWPVEIEQFSHYAEQISLPEIEKLVTVMMGFMKISGDISTWRIYLQSFVNSNLTFILNNPHELVSIFVSLNPAIQNRPKEFLEVLQPFISLLDEMGHYWLTARVRHLVANLLYVGGKFQEAANLWKECIDTYEKIGYESKYGIYHNLAVHHKNLEQYDQAEEFLKKASEGLSEKYLDNTRLLIYRNTGRLGDAIQIAENIVSRVSNFIGPMRTLVELYHEKGIEFDAEEILEKAREIYENQKVDPNKVELQLLEAEIGKYNGNYHQAQKLYQEAISSSIESFALNNLFEVFPKLVEVQFDLVKFKPDNSRYRENLLETLQDIYLLVEEQEIPQGLVKVQLVRSRIFDFLDRRQDAIEACYNAAKLANEFGFENLQIKADQQLEEYRVEEKVVDTDNEGLFTRMRGMIRSLFSGSDGTTSFQKIDYTIYGVMTLTSYGTSVFSKYFSDRLSSEPNLISGLITALTSFMKEVTQSEGMLQSIQHQDMTIMLESIRQGFLTVCIVSKETLELRHKVRTFSEELKEYIDHHDDDLEKGNVTDKFINSVETLVEATFVQ